MMINKMKNSRSSDLLPIFTKTKTFGRELTALDTI